MTLTTDERFRSIFGVAADELTYERAPSVIHPEDQGRVQDSVAAATRPDNPAPYAIDYRVIHPDGSTRWVFAKGRANFEGTGAARRLASFDGTLMDITARKQSDDERDRLVNQLREQDRRKDEWLATLAHELRNPLAPIRSGLQVLKLAPPVDIAAKASEMVDRQLGQMVRIVDDLLDVSRISRDKIKLKIEQVELASVVQHAVEAARSAYDALGHVLTVTLPAKPMHLNADPTRLAQVIVNLLNNACKFTAPGGRIRLTVEREGEEAVVRVEDSGIGIADDQLEGIFQLFRQVDTSLERSRSGLGIGLTLVKRLVEMHSGTVEARSEGIGRGSEFVVRLPALNEAPSPLQQIPTGIQQSATICKRILVVDDNRDAADSLAMLLRIVGHDVHTVHDGQAAVDAAAVINPDVVVLDIGLPGINGYEAARQIRERHGRNGMVLIALTGWGQEEDRRRSTEVGFDAHLVKPVDFAALSKLLDQADNV